jgi:hypothetical protein
MSRHGLDPVISFLDRYSALKYMFFVAIKHNDALGQAPDLVYYFGLTRCTRANWT